MRHETAPEGAANLLIPVRFRMEQPLESQGLAATGVVEDINSGTLDRRPCTRMTTRFHGHTGPTDRVNREIEIVSALLDSSNRYHEVTKTYERGREIHNSVLQRKCRQCEPAEETGQWPLPIRSRLGLLRLRHPDDLLVSVPVDGGVAELPAHPGLLPAAERHVRRHVQVMVHPDSPGIDLGRDLRRRLRLPPDGPAEAVVRVVRTLDRVVDIRVGDHREHRAELLLVHDAAPLLQPGDDRRGEVVAVPGQSRSADVHLRAVRLRGLRQLLHPIELHLVVDRAILDAIGEPIPHLRLLRTLRELRDQGIRLALVHVAALDRDAHLPGVVHRIPEDLRGDLLDVRRRENDRRVVAPALQGDPLHGVRGGLLDRLPRARGPGERDLRDVRMRGEVIMTGNTIVLKPSPFTPLTTMMM